MAPPALHVVVVGAGVIGLTLALRLRERGASVTLLEASRPGAGVTSKSFAWVNSAGKPTSRTYFELRRRGVNGWHADANGRSVGFVASGSLLIADRSRDPTHETWIEEVQSWGEPVETLASSEVLWREPGLAGLDGRVIMSFARDGYLDADVFVAAAIRRLAAMDVVPQSGVPVLRVTTTPAGPTAWLASGAMVRGDAVVVAAGTGSAQITREIPDGLDLRSPHEHGVLGLLAVTSRVAWTPTRVIRTPELNVRAHGQGRLLLHAEDLDEMLTVDEPPDPSSPRATTLRERLRQLVPSAGRAEIAEVLIATRVLSRDGFPVVGWLDPGAAVYCIVAHSGVTLAPVLAELASEEIIHGRTDPILADYRPRT